MEEITPCPLRIHSLIYYIPVHICMYFMGGGGVLVKSAKSRSTSRFGKEGSACPHMRIEFKHQFCGLNFGPVV